MFAIRLTHSSGAHLWVSSANDTLSVPVFRVASCEQFAKSFETQETAAQFATSVSALLQALGWEHGLPEVVDSPEILLVDAEEPGAP